jgi:hypothetical protein
MKRIAPAVALVAVCFLAPPSPGGTSSSAKRPPRIDFAHLRGVLRTPPPWRANTSRLRQRLKRIGLAPLQFEGQVIHIHQHLDIFVNRKHVTVPRFIGIKLERSGALDFITELHTHLSDGVIHLESTTNRPYSLGQFFGTWGVYLSRRCLGGLCATKRKPLHVFLNGRRLSGNPADLVLRRHQEIAIVYGTPPHRIPATYNWPPGF